MSSSLCRPADITSECERVRDTESRPPDGSSLPSNLYVEKSASFSQERRQLYSRKSPKRANCMMGETLPVCEAPVAAPVPASTDLAATFIITSGRVLLILLLIAILCFLLRPRFEEKTPVASVELPPGQRSTDGSAPRVDQTARPAGADPTGAPPSCKSEETGSADSPTAECVTSALALTQRVRDLGLHLGDIVVTGLSIGLPNALTGRPVFDEANLSLLMRGDNLIGPLPEDMLQAQLDRNVVQVHKAADGTRVRKPLNMVEDVIKLASRIGQFDLVSEYGLSPAIVETLDTTYALAVAAGLEVRKSTASVPCCAAAACATDALTCSQRYACTSSLRRRRCATRDSSTHPQRKSVPTSPPLNRRPTPIGDSRASTATRQALCSPLLFRHLTP